MTVERGASAGIYVHVPFCSAICPYCDFAVARGGSSDHRDFTAALLDEIDRATHHDLDFTTVYFGGGTPSLLEIDDLRAVRDALDVRWRLDGASWILEANPEDVNADSAADWRDLGFFGVSLGVQSFDDGRLGFLGRRHSGADARRSVQLCLQAGFEWVSVDVMYGLPESASPGARAVGPVEGLADLDVAAGLGPHHISAYQLTVEPGTPLCSRVQKGLLAELPEEGQAEAFLAVRRRLDELGYAAYEVSNFSRAPEHRSRHNQKYWHRQPYLGFGPSAHSLVGERRWWNERSWQRWRALLLAGDSTISGEETLTTEQRALEDVLLGLRTVDGVDLVAFEGRYGVDLSGANRELIEGWRADGLTRQRPGFLSLSPLGLSLADGLAAELSLPVTRDSGAG